MTLFFLFEVQSTINIVSYRQEVCLMQRFPNTDREEEAPAEEGWVLVTSSSGAKENKTAFSYS